MPEKGGCKGPLSGIKAAEGDLWRMGGWNGWVPGKGGCKGPFSGIKSAEGDLKRMGGCHRRVGSKDLLQELNQLKGT